MKKIFLSLFLILFVASCAWAIYEKTDNVPYSHQFNLRMRCCMKMVAIQNTDSGKVIKRIEGVKDHLCHYVEEDYDISGKMIKKTTCKFTPSERTNFFLTIKKDYDTKGDVTNLLKDYSKDPNICKVEEFKD